MREGLRLSVAGAVMTTGLILWRRYVEQLTRSRDILGTPAIGEETVVTDTVETFLGPRRELADRQILDHAPA
jgi:hypothetical protein